MFMLIRKWLPVLLIFLAFQLSGQISITPSKSINLPEYKYDSLRNNLKEYALGYNGQVLFALPRKQVVSFFNDIDLRVRSFPEKICPSCTNYDSIKGKYFFVNKVFLKKWEQQSDIIFELKEKKSSRIYYYNYGSLEHILENRRQIPSFPFVVVGFYEKLLARFKGQYLRFTDPCLGCVSKEISTSEKIIFNDTEYYYCEDITVPEDIGFLCLLLVKDNKKFYYSIDQARDYELAGIVTKEKFENYLSKQDLRMEKVFNHQIEIGFTTDMIIKSIGKPDGIARDYLRFGLNGPETYIWTYEQKRLYLIIQNNKLIEIGK